MDYEITLGELYDEIADKLAQARTRALMGEREEALGIFRGASLEFTRFQDVLRDYPGFHALDHAFQVTLTALCDEQAAPLEMPALEMAAAKTRRKTRKAA